MNQKKNPRNRPSETPSFHFLACRVGREGWHLRASAGCGVQAHASGARGDALAGAGRSRRAESGNDQGAVATPPDAFPTLLVSQKNKTKLCVFGKFFGPLLSRSSSLSSASVRHGRPVSLSSSPPAGPRGLLGAGVP